jgi:prepilin-type N-terminal cleavage/methylation domain-containing protein
MLRTAPPIRASLGDERGFTLIELLVAMIAGLVLTGALLAILEISLRQTTRLTDRVQVDRSGRTAMNSIVDELHSSCTGFGATAIQLPSSTPVSPLASLGATNLWFLSSYASAESASPAVTKVYLHDINWTATGTSSTGEQVGTLRDYSFTGSGEPNYWTFPALATTNATARVLAKNVIPLTTSTVFEYSRYDTNAADVNTYGELVPVNASELTSVAENKKVAKVAISFKQAPENADTHAGHTTEFNASVVLRLTPPESAAEGFTCI